MIRHALILLLLVTTAASAAPKRRSVGRNGGPDPATWLAQNATRLHALELPADDSDLEPLRAIVGDADVVGLGDGTHGTHEFYTIKLRTIDFLVRELGFDVISFEAPFALFDRINAYVQGGPGDPRALLREAVGYGFWKAEELVAVIEWMRDYNAHRGARPAIEIAGADIYDSRGAAQAVIAYLRSVDATAAAAAERDYACILASTTLVPFGCISEEAIRVRDRLAARRTELEPVRGKQAYEEALHHATVITQTFAGGLRDENMALNVQWLLEHRSEARRVVYWAHSEHVGQAPSPQVAGLPTGMNLKNALGDDYVSIATLGNGTFTTYDTRGAHFVNATPTPPVGSYEWYFRTAPAPAALIPLRGAVPSWLAGPANFFWAGIIVIDNPYMYASLPAKHDAVIFIHATTPLRPLGQ